MKQGYSYRFILQDGTEQEIEEEFYDFHYNLTTYLNLTLRAGFTVVGFEELNYPESVIEKYKVPSQFGTFPQSLVIVGKK